MRRAETIAAFVLAVALVAAAGSLLDYLMKARL